MPLDVEALVATLGPEEATRVCFELMEAAEDAPPSDEPRPGSGEAEQGVPEQLAVLQGYFPHASLEDLFEALSLQAGSLDGAIAMLLEAQEAQQEAQQEQQAQQAEAEAAQAAPSAKEKEKVAQLHQVYTVSLCSFLFQLVLTPHGAQAVDKELLLAVLRSANGSRRGAVATLEQMGLGFDINGAIDAATANGSAAAARGRAGRFAAATAAAASAPPYRRGGYSGGGGGGFNAGGGSGERREWRGRFPPGGAPEGPSYSELRQAASAHYDAMRRAVVASGHAAELGDRTGAAKHQAAAREAKALAEAANAAAGALTLATRNAGNHGRVTRDLHALHVAEALQEVQRWIGFVATAHSGGTMTLQFVTGRGAHSAQGARILPAVEEYLVARGIPYVLTNAGGCVEVSVDEALRQALLARADAAPSDAAPAVTAGPSRYDGIKRGGDF